MPMCQPRDNDAYNVSPHARGVELGVKFIFWAGYVRNVRLKEAAGNPRGWRKII
jgi:hypothetical protein